MIWPSVLFGIVCGLTTRCSAVRSCPTEGEERGARQAADAGRVAAAGVAREAEGRGLVEGGPVHHLAAQRPEHLRRVRSKQGDDLAARAAPAAETVLERLQAHESSSVRVAPLAMPLKRSCSASACHLRPCPYRWHWPSSQFAPSRDTAGVASSALWGNTVVGHAPAVGMSAALNAG